MANCVDCGTKLTLLNKSTAERCYPCAKVEFENRDPNRVAAIKPQISEEEAIEKERKASIEAIMVTTETHPDIGISARLGIVTAECAYGMNVFKDVFAGIRNIVGGRSKAIQQTMRDARETVLYELKQEASLLGADAVVAVDLDYVQIGDGGWSMVMLVASGTAVKIEKPAAA
ncbi:Uncharacterized conserved protein YbjQ, UPF0145 family [Sulfitobacter pontiacus]|uniref:UPF0145 protein SAMN04488041_103131 n=2 Tax=Sulfitobacter pontiacus TaxID=60137 RepID=A0A1H2W2E1_9RHOB|nr:Uncharacterized conserved protein YbjQ, UPF0145 family [Sulfitobacter pontiacus]